MLPITVSWTPAGLRNMVYQWPPVNGSPAPTYLNKLLVVKGEQLYSSSRSSSLARKFLFVHLVEEKSVPKILLAILGSKFTHLYLRAGIMCFAARFAVGFLSCIALWRHCVKTELLSVFSSEKDALIQNHGQHCCYAVWRSVGCCWWHTHNRSLIISRWTTCYPSSQVFLHLLYLFLLCRALSQLVVFLAHWHL